MNVVFLQQKKAMFFNNNSYLSIKDFIKNNHKNNAKLIAVSKNHPKSSVLLAINSGVRVFGENKVQEAVNKFSEILDKNKEIELHLTGPLQTNKVKEALKIFHVFHTLDREKLAKELHKHQNLLINKKFFIQINTGEEETKSGIAPKQANDFINYCKKELKINVCGLMCIPPIKEKPSKHFKLLANIAKENNLLNLSMGMSNDYKEAILSGATHIRIGTNLFGERVYEK